MHRIFSALLALVALGVLAPRAFADSPPPPPSAPSASAVVGDCGCCPAASTCCPPRDPCRKSHLELQVHGAMLTPDPEGPLGLAGSTASWDSIEYGVAIGGRVAYTRPLGGWDATLGATWWGKWDDDSSTSGTSVSTATPGGAPAVAVLGASALHEEATLWDVNLTLTKPFYCTPCFTADWGFGLRYLRFEEDASFTTVTGVIALFINTFDSEIDNALLAPELVVSGTWKLNSSWDVTARASAFAGWMHRSGDIASSGGALVSPSDTSNDVGFGGELEVTARWHLNCSWSVSVGYGLLVLGNVTRGHEAFDFSRTASGDFGPVFADDTLLVHRAFIGIGLDF
jgi:hypothetical protein